MENERLTFQCQGCFQWLPSGNTPHSYGDCQKYKNSEVALTRTAVAREIISAYDDMLDGMGKGQDDFKKSDWDYVQSLKPLYHYQEEKK